ncbi:hypothetical protein ABFA25_04040 [Mycobacterium lepromatosis]
MTNEHLPWGSPWYSRPVSLVLIEGENVEGVTVEQYTFQLAAGGDSATS